MNKHAKPKVQLFWFKRDLRTHDHGPLDFWQKASLENPGQNNLGIYIIEEGYWETEKASAAQLQFVAESALELQSCLQAIGGKLLILKCSCAAEAFKLLLEHLDITKIICHRETGNKWTFERDKRVIKLAKALNIEFIELLQDSLIRGSKTRVNNFSDAYYKFVTTSQFEVPKKLKSLDCTFLEQKLSPILVRESPRDIVFNHNIQKGGEGEGIKALISFLETRCLGQTEGYRKEMSTPLTAHVSCSRISSHLTWGTLSARASYQTARNALNCLPYYDKRVKHIQSFITRLAWRLHFMQKFETLHWMEFKCLNPKSESLHSWDEDAFEAWKNGMTGYPFIDACIRSMNATKWLNFRARAMIVSFASYALNLDWRGFGPHLAQNFLDYEPGIHYSQLQMQGGTTIGSPPRIYSPLKQSIEKDPKGEFIRLWVPELKDCPESLIHLPSDYPRNNYPPSIVDHTRLWNIMRSNAPKSPKPRVITKGPIKRPLKINNNNQLELQLEVQNALPVR